MIKAKTLHYSGIFLILFTIVTTSCKTTTLTSKPEVHESKLRGTDFRNYNYLLSEAIKHKVLGNYGQAIVYFKQCLEINPLSDAALFELSSIYLYARDYPLALEYARKATAADGDNLWYQLQLASLYSIQEINDSSILIYENLVKKHPEKLDLMFQLGNMYAKDKTYDKALDVYNKLERNVGFQESVSIARIDIYKQTGQIKRAEEELYMVLSLFPDNVDYQILLAELFYEQGENEKAGKKYKKLLIDFPGIDKVYLSIIRFQMVNQEYSEMIRMVDSVILGNNSEMEIKFNLVVSLISDQELLPMIKEELSISLIEFQKQYSEDIRILALLGDFYVKTGEYELAAHKFKEYIKYDIQNYLVWEQLLFLLNILEETDDLYIFSNKAIEYFPGAPILYFFNGLACTELGKNNETIDILIKGLGFVENNNSLLVQYYSLLGEAYKNNKQYEKSDLAFEDALAIDPGNLMVLNNYSYYLSLRGDKLKKALKMSKICIDMEPANSTYLDTYAWVLYNMRKYASSEKFLRKAIDNNTNPGAEILEHYGDVNEKLNKPELAVEYWRKAVDAGGDEEKLLKKIKNVGSKR